MLSSRIKIRHGVDASQQVAEPGISITDMKNAYIYV